jgi:hypothetical protein
MAHAGAMLAYDYPLLGIFWTTLVFFVFVVWIVLLLQVIVDIIRGDDLGGVAKVLWLIFVIVLPYLGVFAYLIARGDKMTARRLNDAAAQEAALRTYVRDAAEANPASQIEQLASLRDRGVISENEFEVGKAKALS